MSLSATLLFTNPETPYLISQGIANTLKNIGMAYDGLNGHTNSRTFFQRSPYITIGRNRRCAENCDLFE
jgi:hypothetical protein